MLAKNNAPVGSTLNTRSNLAMSGCVFDAVLDDEPPRSRARHTVAHLAGIVALTVGAYGLDAWYHFFPWQFLLLLFLPGVFAFFFVRHYPCLLTASPTHYQVSRRYRAESLPLVVVAAVFWPVSAALGMFLFPFEALGCLKALSSWCTYNRSGVVAGGGFPSPAGPQPRAA